MVYNARRSGVFIIEDPEQGMDRALKERIIGAIVLVAVVVLVVPVFLDGPPEDGGIVRERLSLPGQESDGTRTVVLERDRSEPVPQEQAPASRQTTATSAAQAAKEQPLRADSEAGAPAQAADAPQAAPEPAPVIPEPAADTSTEEPAEPPPTRSSTGVWAVQLGSFSNEANAERLAAELREQGFAAFLSKLATGSGELHRVRVGPQRDREAAETMLARLERAGQNGQVVPHP